MAGYFDCTKGEGGSPGGGVDKIITNTLLLTITLTLFCGEKRY